MSALAGTTLVMAQDSQAPTTDPEPVAEAPTKEQIEARLHDIGAALAAAAPIAAVDDARTREAAATNLAKVAALIDAADEHVLWGVYDEAKGADVERYSGTRVNSLVLTKAYLSMFGFDQAARVWTSGDHTLFEMPVKFRDRLGASEYPYPLWSTHERWGTYTRTTSLIFVFHGMDLAAVLRRVDTKAPMPPERRWNGQWEWTDLRGRPQPRAAQFEFLLSEENPESERLQTAYKALDEKLRAHRCMNCHSPDSGGGGARLAILRYPNELLGVRESLLELLKAPHTAAVDPHRVHADGIPDEAALTQLTDLAATFAGAAEGALSYEAARRAAAAGRHVGP